jgi:prepilin-type processing-associated H-X9-DG protein
VDFTLVELLVAMAVIMVLASLLLPGLKKCKEKSAQINCVSGMRQLGLGFSSYGGDYNGWYPPCYKDNRWTCKISGYAGKQEGESYSLTKCSAWYDIYNSQPLISYQVHDFWSIPLGSQYFSTGSRAALPWPGFSFSLKYPTQFPLLTEGAEGTAGSNMCYPYGTRPLIQKRHQKGANFVFYDGHGEFWTGSKITVDHLDYFILP